MLAEGNLDIKHIRVAFEKSKQMTDVYYDELHPKSTHLTGIEFDMFICHLAHEVYQDKEEEAEEEEAGQPERLSSPEKINKLMDLLH